MLYEAGTPSRVLRQLLTLNHTTQAVISTPMTFGFKHRTVEVFTIRTAGLIPCPSTDDLNVVKLTSLNDKSIPHSSGFMR